MTAQDERAAVVAWLRSDGDWPLATYHAAKLADRIERGDHVTGGGRVMAHKDLSDTGRRIVSEMALGVVLALHQEGQSLALAREAWINAFDKEAEQLSKDEKSSIERPS